MTSQILLEHGGGRKQMVPSVKICVVNVLLITSSLSQATVSA